MNWKNTTLAEGIKYPGFCWYMTAEIMLIIAGIISAFRGNFELAILIFILIEIRDMNLHIKNP